eukprot:CAMPEP_0171262974 /NCGR_PEP_ID=MMETSP0790-20130122/56847_1 /TAXON_ID=2925 /ORGANISM="Alexandrium catenella, Strain OF101" /LENGTH=83 /DNA_ID=CAMNT_0011731551 /DNA_START=10 /DNA_END=259 /DNA_ORIENTATION=-
MTAMPPVAGFALLSALKAAFVSSLAPTEFDHCMSRGRVVDCVPAGPARRPTMRLLKQVASDLECSAGAAASAVPADALMSFMS